MAEAAGSGVIGAGLAGAGAGAGGGGAEESLHAIRLPATSKLLSTALKVFMAVSQ